MACFKNSCSTPAENRCHRQFKPENNTWVPKLVCEGSRLKNPRTIEKLSHTPRREHSRPPTFHVAKGVKDADKPPGIKPGSNQELFLLDKGTSHRGAQLDSKGSFSCAYPGSDSHS